MNDPRLNLGKILHSGSSKKLILFSKISISILLLVFLFWKFGLKEIIKTISTISASLVILVLLIFLINIILGSWKIFILFNALKTKLNFFSLLKHYTISWFLSFFTPAKIGQFSLVYFLKKERVKVGESSAVFVVDKIIGLTTLFILSISGFFIFFKTSEALKIVLISLFLISFLSFASLSRVGKNLIKKIILRRYSKVFVGFSKAESLILKKKSLILKNFVISMANWVINAVSVYILFVGFNQKISLFSVVSINAVLGMISFIPISISGLGVREASAVFFFSKLGIEPVIVLTTFIFLSIINYLLAVIVITIFLNRRTLLTKNTGKLKIFSS